MTLPTWPDILGQPSAVSFLRGAAQAARLPHAMIFAGPVGVGKATTALALAGWFLCQNPKADLPCGICESCRGLAAGNHPDYHVITKELIRYHDKDGKSKGIELSIKVIRPELIERGNHTAVMARGKFFVIQQAELLNVAAQNAMLKTLEEPPGRTAIVLLSDAPQSLLPTIRSRCQWVAFARLDARLVRLRLEQQGIDPPTAAEAAALADGSLGFAMQLIRQDILPAARQLQAQLDAQINGRPPDDLPAWLRKAAEAYAEKELERDPLSSKDAAMRDGLSLYLNLAARHLSRRLHAPGAAGLENTCSAIDAVARCQMYVDANVNVPVALAQLASALSAQFTSA